MNPLLRRLSLALVCLFVLGTAVHAASVLMALDLGDGRGGHVSSDGGCADCGVRQEAAMTCGDLCAAPFAAFACAATSGAVAGRLPQCSLAGALPRGRLGLPEPHPPKGSVSI